MRRRHRKRKSPPKTETVTLLSLEAASQYHQEDPFSHLPSASYLARLAPDVARELGHYVRHLDRDADFALSGGYDGLQPLSGRSLRECEQRLGVYQAVEPYDFYDLPCDADWWRYVLDFHSLYPRVRTPAQPGLRLAWFEARCLCGRTLLVDQLPGHEDCGPTVRLTRENHAAFQANFKGPRHGPGYHHGKTAKLTYQTPSYLRAKKYAEIRTQEQAINAWGNVHAGYYNATLTRPH